MFTVSVGDGDTVKITGGCMQKGVRSGLSVKLSSIEICDFINILFQGLMYKDYLYWLYKKQYYRALVTKNDAESYCTKVCNLSQDLLMHYWEDTL